MNNYSVLTQEYVSKMKQAAELATQGQWVTDGDDVNQHGDIVGTYVAQSESAGCICVCFANCLVTTDEQLHANAEFIAYAHPTAILALIEAKERLNVENVDLMLTIGKLRVEREIISATQSKPVGYFILIDGQHYPLDASLRESPEAVQLYDRIESPSREQDEYSRGIEAAACYVDALARAFASERGNSDSDTGAYEFNSMAQAKHFNELIELAGGIRALVGVGDGD